LRYERICCYIDTLANALAKIIIYYIKND